MSCVNPYTGITWITWYMMSSSSYPAAPTPWNHQRPTKPWCSVKLFPLSRVKPEVTLAEGMGEDPWLQSSAGQQPGCSAATFPSCQNPRVPHLQPAEACPGTARRTWTGTAPCWACRAPRPSPAPCPWSPGGCRTPARPRRRPAGCSSPRPPRSGRRSRCGDTAQRRRSLPAALGNAPGAPRHDSPRVQEHSTGDKRNLAGPKLHSPHGAKGKSLTQTPLSQTLALPEM